MLTGGAMPRTASARAKVAGPCQAIITDAASPQEKPLLIHATRFPASVFFAGTEAPALKTGTRRL